MYIEKVNEMLERFYNCFYDIEDFSLKQGIKMLTTTELHVIEAIGKDTINMNELSDKLKITMGTATVAITKLTEKGFINRKRCDEDRRKVYVSLSPLGINALDYHQNFHKSIISNITKNLTESELVSFMDVFNKILDNLESQLDYSRPVPLNEFIINSNLKIVRIKGTPAIQEFFAEKEIFEGKNAKIINLDNDSIILDTGIKTISISIADAKNIYAIKM